MCSVVLSLALALALAQEDLAPALEVPTELRVEIVLIPDPEPADLVLEERRLLTLADEPEAGRPEDPGIGEKYRLLLGEGLSLHPWGAFRKPDAPWDEEEGLPMVHTAKLALDTEAQRQNLLAWGVSLSASPGSLDFLGYLGADAYVLAVGFTLRW